MVTFNDNAVVEGQNLFFTNEASTEVAFVMDDDDTNYTTSNIGDYLTLEKSAASASSYRVVQESVVAGSSAGTVRVTYTVYFSAKDGGSVKDKPRDHLPETER